MADHPYLHLRFPSFVSLQLSVSSLSVCCVFLASPSLLPLFSPQSLLFTSSRHFFFPLRLLSLSVSSFPFPAFLSESFPGLLFLSLLTGAFLVFHSLQLTYWYFPLTLTPSPSPQPPPFVIFFFSPIIFSSTFLPLSLSNSPR